MTPAEVIVSLPSLKDSNCTCKDTGLLACLGGGCFLRHMILSPQKPLFPPWEPQDWGSHAAYKYILFYLSWAF